MPSAKELDSLGRITLAIKTYRYQTADYQDPQYNVLLRAYLHQYLSAQDWQLWKDLQVEHIALPEPLATIGKPVSPIEFEQLLNRYRQVGYELIRVWQQECRALLQGSLLK